MAQGFVEPAVTVLRGFVFGNEEFRQRLTNVGVGVIRVELHRAFEMANGVAYLGDASGTQQGTPLEVLEVRVGELRRLPRETAARAGVETELQRPHHVGRDLILHGEHIASAAIVTGRPYEAA